MSDILTAVELAELRDEAIYTPAELALHAKCSASYVREEIKRCNLIAFRFGNRMIRIKGNEAKKWIGKFAGTSSDATGETGASSGAMATRGGDIALMSVLKDRRPKA